MKKFSFLLALALIVAGGAFAQRVGDTVQLGGETWTVQSISGDTATIRKVPGLDGTWNETSTWTRVVTISGDTGVFTAFGSNALVQNGVSKGYYKVGDPYFRNITKTGDLTWSGQEYGLTGSGSNATGARWNNCTFTLSADGQTLQVRAGNTTLRFTRSQ